MKILLALIVAGQLNAHEKHHEHREHKAHVHGEAVLNIAFDGNKGKVEFKAPAESIFGFEYEAKSEKDKKIVSEKLNSFETKISSLISFDSTLGCKLTKEKLSIKTDGKKNSKHSDVEAIFNIICDKSPLGHEVIFNFQSEFKKIKNIEVQLIIDDFQKSLDVKTSGTKLLIK